MGSNKGTTASFRVQTFSLLFSFSIKSDYQEICNSAGGGGGWGRVDSERVRLAEDCGENLGRCMRHHCGVVRYQHCGRAQLPSSTTANTSHQSSFYSRDIKLRSYESIFMAVFSQ